jgi:hypothetical protein
MSESIGFPSLSGFQVIEYTSEIEYAPIIGSGKSALIPGDAIRVLAALPFKGVQTVVTSPPYWSLRDYGIERQIGLEGSVDLFIRKPGDSPRRGVVGTQG